MSENDGGFTIAQPGGEGVLRAEVPFEIGTPVEITNLSTPEEIRVGTLSQVRRIAQEAAQADLNRQIPGGLLGRLGPRGHVFTKLMDHAFAQQKPAQPHVRAMAYLRVIGRSEPEQVMVDVPMRQWERLSLRRKSVRKSDPTWVEVSEMLGTLLDQTLRNPPAIESKNGYVPADDATTRPLPRQWVNDLEPYWIDQGMQRVITKAASEELDEHAFAFSDPLTPRGFAVFSEIIVMPHEEWGQVPIRALSWVTTPEGVWTMVWIDLMAEGAPTDIEALPDQRLWPGVFTLFVDEEPVGAPKTWVNADEIRKPVLLFQRRLVMALWLVSSSRVGMVHARSLPRGLRRAAARRKAPEQVVVVSLRRRESSASDVQGGEVAWSHRWLVSGYWRRRWREKEGTVRMEWVSPHVKGPEDKPLVVKDRFYRLER